MHVTTAIKEIDRLQPTTIVQQTAFWGRVERRLGLQVHAFDLRAVRRPLPGGRGQASGGAASYPEPQAHGDFLVVRRPLSAEAELAYVPFGPELAAAEGTAGRLLEQLSEQIRPVLGPRCLFVRWDLPWESPYSREASRYDADGRWLGAPEPWVRELRMNFGTERRGLRKAPLDMLPVNTMLVDLTADEEQLLARMKPKTRYAIRLAARRGVMVVRGGPADLPDWYRLYLETAARHGLPCVALEAFRAVLDERAEASCSPVQTRLLLARRGRDVLAGMVLALSGSRATFLYGASTREHRDCMASHALQWAAMRLARAAGCREYDLFGVSPSPDIPHPLAGLYRFKAGFGGWLVHREGCWDYPYDVEQYERWRACEQIHAAGRPG